MVYATLSSSSYTSSAMSSSIGSITNNNPFAYLQEDGCDEPLEAYSPSSSDNVASASENGSSSSDNASPMSENADEKGENTTSALTSILTSLQQDKSSDILPLETELAHTWTFWALRPPQGLRSTLLNFESLLKCIGSVKTLGEFWSIYLSLKRPDELSNGTTDFSFFKDGIRPVWEDPANEHGGKLVIRFKKYGTISGRLWELLLLALIGDELADIQDHICGAVFSIRPYENFVSIWTPHSDDLVQIQLLRDRFRTLFGLSPETPIEYKVHNYKKEENATLPIPYSDENLNSVVV